MVGVVCFLVGDMSGCEEISTPLTYEIISPIYSDVCLEDEHLFSNGWWRFIRHSKKKPTLADPKMVLLTMVWHNSSWTDLGHFDREICEISREKKKVVLMDDHVMMAPILDSPYLERSDFSADKYGVCLTNYKKENKFNIKCTFILSCLKQLLHILNSFL